MLGCFFLLAESFYSSSSGSKWILLKYFLVVLLQEICEYIEPYSQRYVTRLNGTEYLKSYVVTHISNELGVMRLDV